jgi:hypothetical protein
VPDERASGYYDAFISYNWSFTRAHARALESALAAIWKRCGLEPRLRLFRDESEQRFGGLSSTLTDNLLRSRYLLVLLHRGSRDSQWMDFEIRTWLESGGHPDRMVLVRADDSLDLSWGEGTFRDPDGLPPVLAETYVEQPLHVNLTRSRTGRVLDPSFELARLCATVMGVEPALVLQRELRLQRRRQRRALALVLVFALLAVAAIGASALALRSRAVAQEQRTEAEAQALAAEAMLGSTTRPAASIGLLQDAAARSEDKAVRLAIYSVLNDNPDLAHVIDTAPLGGAPDDLAFDSAGSDLVAWRTLPGDRGSRVVVWSLASQEVVARGTVPGGTIQTTNFVDQDTLAACRSDGGVVLTWDDPSGATPAGIRVRQTGRERDDCRLLPMVLGATLIDVADGRAVATVVGPRGRVSSSRVITFALGAGGADRVLLEPSTGPWLLETAAGTVRDVPGTASADIDSALGGGDTGPFVVRSAALGTVAVDPLDSEAGPTQVALPPDVAWTVPLADGSDDYVWVNRSGTVGWTVDGRRLDVAGPRPPTVTPKLWRLADGRFIVDDFTRAVGLKVHGDGPARRLHQTGSMDVDTIFSSRSGTAPTAHVGSGGIFFPTGNDRYGFFDGTTTTAVVGLPFFDDRQNAAAVLGDGQVSLFHPGDEGSTELDKTGSAYAAAISPEGSLVAVAGAPGSIAVFRTATAEDDAGLVRRTGATWTTSTAYSGAVFASHGGSGVVRRLADGTRTDYPAVTGQVAGLFAADPGGREALVALQGRSVGQDIGAALVRADGSVRRLGSGPCTPDSGRFTYLPDAGFRTDVEAARHATLVQLDASGGPPQACLGDGDDVTQLGLAPDDQVLQFAMRGGRGQILARESNGGALQSVTWGSGSRAPTVRSLADTGAGWAGALDDDGTDALVWNTGNGTLAWQVLGADGEWRVHRSARFDVADVVAGLLRPDLGIAVVVGSDGAVQFIDFASGRVVLSTSVGAGFEQVVMAATLQYADGVFRLVATTGKAGLVTLGAVGRSVPWRMDLLRGALCTIAPRAAPEC